MYEKVLPITLKSSSSALFANLDILPDKTSNSSSSIHNGSYLSVHKGYVNVVSQGNGMLNHVQVTTKESSGSSHGCLITQAKWCKLQSQDVLVVTHHKGFQIFTAEGTLLLFWYNLLESGLVEEGKAAFCRGIAVCNNLICVGTCTGQIIVTESRGNNFSVIDKLSAHTAPISALSSITNSNASNMVAFVSCDDLGTIITWNLGKKFQTVATSIGCSIPGSDILLLPNNLVVCGYVTGHIRVFDALSGDMLIEVAAHGKSVTSLDVVRDDGGLANNEITIVSGGEDSCIRVWKVSNNEKPKMYQDWFVILKDVQICGVKFCDHTDTAFGVTGYDRSEISMFAKVM